MTRLARDSSLWLPGFDHEDQAFPPPNLFTDTLASSNEHSSEAPQFDVDESDALPSWRPALAAEFSAPTFDWPAWNDDALASLDGQVMKFEANVAAITALRRITDPSTSPSTEERNTLLRYTGWGGIPASFNLDGHDASWRSRAKLLRELLSADDYDSAKASVNNSHYTDPLVIHWIWTLLRRIGFTGGTIVEPSAGNGHFIGCMPREIASRAHRPTRF